MTRNALMNVPVPVRNPDRLPSELPLSEIRRKNLAMLLAELDEVPMPEGTTPLEPIEIVDTNSEPEVLSNGDLAMPRNALAGNPSFREAENQSMNALMATREVDRGMIVPLVEYADGSIEPGLPQMVTVPVDAITNMLMPGYDYSNTEQAARDAFDASMPIMTGGVVTTAVRPKNALGIFGGRMKGKAPAPEPEAPRLPRPKRPEGKSIIPQAGRQMTATQADELMGAVAQNPHVRAIPGVQGLPSKARQERLLRESINSGATPPTPGPWGGFADPHAGASNMISQHLRRQSERNTALPSSQPKTGSPSEAALPQSATPASRQQSIASASNLPPLPQEYTQVARQAFDQIIADGRGRLQPRPDMSPQAVENAVTMFNSAFQRAGLQPLPREELIARYGETVRRLLVRQDVDGHLTGPTSTSRAFGRTGTMAIPAAIGAGAAADGFNQALSEYRQIVIDMDGDGVPDMTVPVRP